MNILFLALEPPYPPNDGGRIRTFNLIKQLAQEHHITLVAFGSDQYSEGLRALREMCGSVCIVPRPVVERPTPAERLQLLLRRQPNAIRLYRSRQMALLLGRLLRQNAYDVVHVDQIYLAPYAKEFSGLPSVMNHNDIEAEKQRRWLMRDRHRYTLYWWLRWIEHFQWRAFEIRSLAWFDVHCVVSERDAIYLSRHGSGIPVVVVPNGVDIVRFQSQPKESPRPVLLYVGSMDYQANIDAVLWFQEYVLPQIQATIPDVHFVIVGRNPPPEIQQLTGLPNVSVTGTVPDVRPYYQQARALIVPLRIGGGTRLKVLEAMATGVPVVSTSLGCEGLSLVPGRDLLVADEPGEFATKTVQLLKDRAIGSQIARRARRIVENQYDWRAIGQQLVQTYHIAIDHSKQRQTRGVETSE